MEQMLRKKLNPGVNILSVGIEKEEQRNNIVGNRGNFNKIMQNGIKKKEDKKIINVLRPETLTNVERKTSIKMMVEII